jgi:Dolichyl-phosphate-mannose-protein mannosyltransferase
MSLLAPNRMLRTGIHSGSSPFLTVRLLRTLANFAETQGWVLFASICLAFGWGRMISLGSRRLDHDELFTFYIAQAPTLRQLLALTHTVDLHPPLSYLLVRASFAIFGVSSWSCRLPFLLAFFCAAALLFWFVRGLLSSVYALVAVLFLMSTPFTGQADEARPYSLLVCFTMLMLVAWRQAIDRPNRRRWALTLLIASGFGLLLSHVLGVFPYACFFVAEAVRFSIRRRPDWKLWTALLIPATSVVTYLPLIRLHSGIVFTDQYQATPLRIFDCYWWSARFLTIPMALVAVLACVWPRRKALTPGEQPSTTFRVFSPDTLPVLAWLLGCLALIPLVIGLLFARTGTAFFDRYGILVIIPIALVPTVLLGVRTRQDPVAGVVVGLVLSLVFLLTTKGKPWLIEQVAYAPPQVARYTLNAFELPILMPGWVGHRVPSYLQNALASASPVSNLDTVEPDLPLVANTGLTFLEIDHEGDNQLTRRLYLLDDRQAAVSIAHDTVFENYDRLTKVFPIRGKVEPYCDFISEHPRFLILGTYDHPQGWLLKRLDLERAHLKLLGTYASTLEEHEIYEVNLSANLCLAPNREAE